MNKIRKEDIRQEVFDLYDDYASNRIDRRQFVDKLSVYAIGGLTVPVLLRFILPNYHDQGKIEMTIDEILSPKGEIRPSLLTQAEHDLPMKNHLLNKLKLCYISSIVLLTLFTIVTCSKGPQRANTDQLSRKWLDIAYANQSDAQKLDIYLPEEGAGPFPVIVSIHGGAFKSGDKQDEQLKPMLEGLHRGYAVVSVNYRLSGEAKWPAQLYDCKAAVRWIRNNASRYQLNPDKIGAWGGSAGGHLSAMLGTSGGVQLLEDLTQGNPDHSSNVQAVVDWFGPINFLTLDDQFTASGKGNPDHSEANSPESELLGQKITEIPDQVKTANPETYISPDDPPVFIQHGTTDNLIPSEQSESFYTKLKAILGEGNVTLDLIDGAGHGGPKFNSKENLDKVFGFLDRKLKK